MEAWRDSWSEKKWEIKKFWGIFWRRNIRTNAIISMHIRARSTVNPFLEPYLNLQYRNEKMVFIPFFFYSFRISHDSWYIINKKIFILQLWYIFLRILYTCIYFLVCQKFWVKQFLKKKTNKLKLLGNAENESWLYT